MESVSSAINAGYCCLSCASLASFAAHTGPTNFAQNACRFSWDSSLSRFGRNETGICLLHRLHRPRFAMAASRRDSVTSHSASASASSRAWSERFDATAQSSRYSPRGTSGATAA